MEKLISLCMIVKDEEKVLRRCLESVKTLVDEMIIVDTGSVDQTKSIAREYTDKVFDFTWINDFSAARNESIKHASGQWILWLDADEYVQKEGQTQLREYLSQFNLNQPAGILLPIMNFVGVSEHQSTGMVESSAVRCFSNHRSIRFKGAIHEQITCETGQIHFTRYSYLIFHSGYTAQLHQEKNKNERNLEIFAELQKNRQLETPYDHFTLANEYHAAHQLEKATYHYERAYRGTKASPIWLPQCMDRMIIVYIELQKYVEANELIEQGIKNWSHCSDFYCLKGMLLDTLGLYEEAKGEFERSIQIAEQCESRGQVYWIVNLHYGTLLPYEKLAEIYYKLQDIPKTVFALTKILNRNNQQYYALYRLANLLVQSEESTSVSTFLEKIYPLSQQTNAILLFQTFLILGHRELTEHYYQICLEKQIPLSEQDLLRYALLMNHELAFQEHVLKIPPSSYTEEMDRLLILAAVTWENGEYLQYISDESEREGGQQLKELAHHILNQASVPQPIENDGHLHSLLTDCYRIHSFDAYDKLVHLYASVPLIQQLAHYFYQHHELELALDYFSILLDNNGLDAESYSNLALLQIASGNPAEGTAFIERAIELEPEQLYLYSLYLKYGTDPVSKQMYKRLLHDRFPRYKGLPYFHLL